MKRLTTNDENHILASLNLFYCKDNEVWIRGGGPEPDYADCTLVDWIVSAAEKHHLDIFSRDAEGLGEEMYDSMQFGSDTIEGIVALLHAAAIQAAEMRGHLAAIEDILGDEYDLELVQKLIQAYKEGRYIIMKEPEQAGVSRLRELAQADREGRCVVLPCKVEDDVYINILGRTLPFTVISISQMASTPTFKAQHGIRLVYIFKADDVGETVFLTRAEAKAALRREQDG